MKYYKKLDNSTWGFELDGSQDHLITPDMIPLTDDEMESLMNPPKSLAQIKAEITGAIQNRLDLFARERGYDSILSACTYATSTIPVFASEGQYCVDARDNTWSAAYVILTDCLTGKRTLPSVEDVLLELPQLSWPE
jgi:hypothetical protein